MVIHIMGPFKPNKNNYLLLFWLLFLSLFQSGHAKELVLTPDKDIFPLGVYVEYLEDKERNYDLSDVRRPELAQQFKPSQKQRLHFNFSYSAYWLRFTVDFSNADHRQWYFIQRFQLIDTITLFFPDDNGRYIRKKTQGETLAFSSREFNHRQLIFELPDYNTPVTFYARIQDQYTVVADFEILSERGLVETTYSNQTSLGLYYGWMLIMIFYNTFLFISLRDKSYFYYIIYVASNILFVLKLDGLALQYLWPESPNLNWIFNLSIFIAQHSILLFANSFLQTEKFSPKTHQFINLCIIINILIFIIGFIFFTQGEVGRFVSVSAIVFVSIVWVSGIIAWKNGYHAARFYVLAWSFYLLGIIIYPLQNFGIIETSFITDHSIQIGAAIEALLLSLALGDRYNSIKSEKIAAEEKAKRQLTHANERLEREVSKRTQELAQSMEELGHADKMSTLGTMVAGVAHELNNPAGFVQISSINLEKDLEKFKRFLFNLVDEQADREVLDAFQTHFNQLSQHIQTIQDGSERISTTVKDLRTFSRLDEAEQKEADVVAGLISTLNIVQANFQNQIQIKTHIQAQPQMLCWPAQLNQVFMNMAVNGCQAIIEHKSIRHDDVDNILNVYTETKEDDLIITFKDNGIGMEKHTIDKIFTPFYTTKDIDQGTGLGLSICFSIINRHQGKITVESTPMVGSTFKITLPLNPEH